MDEGGGALLDGKTAERMEPARVGERDGPPLKLLVLDGSTTSGFELPRSGSVVIGRAADAQLRVADPSVSRRHAEIFVEGGRTRVRDLGSSHGTLVNGEKIVEARTLAAGDVVSIGDVTLAVRSEARAARPSPLLSEEQVRRRLEQEIERSLRYGRELAVFDLAPGAGRVDRAALAAEVTSRLRVIDVGGWTAGGHFLVVAPELPEADVNATARALLAGALVHAREARVGVSTCPMDGADPDTLLASARAAAGVAAAADVAAASDMVTALDVAGKTLLVADPAMSRLYALVKRLAATDLTVLVTGETGVGKEHVATALHAWSPRAKGRFVAINGAAMPETLVESELFGFEKGAFSGAAKEKPGLLESASGGTLFLDEVGDLTPGAQAKLLRVLETRRVMRLGDLKEREVDVRIVAATNRDLEADVKAGRFREDLFFRLSAASVYLPPLRERPREVPVLAQRFLDDACLRLARPRLLVTAPAMRRLVSHSWPGNVRELKNVMEVAAATAPGPALEPEDLPDRLGGRVDRAVSAPSSDRPSVASDAPVRRETGEDPAVTRAQSAPTPPPGEPFRPVADELADLEKRRMLEALEACGGVQTRAAELIGMPRRTFLLKMKKYGIGKRAG